MRNTCLDDFKKDIKNINNSFEYIHNKVMDIVDNEGFTKDTINLVGKKIKELTRDLIRVRQNADSFEEYVIEGEKFTKVKYRLDELVSSIKILELACITDKSSVYNYYLDDVICNLARLSDNLVTFSTTLNSEDVVEKELDLLKTKQNKLHIIKN